MVTLQTNEKWPLAEAAPMADTMFGPAQPTLQFQDEFICLWT